MSSLAKGLPIKLRKEPLIDTVFEVRFVNSDVLLSQVLPGVLLQNLNTPDFRITPLMASDIPASVRRVNPDFKYLPTVSLNWGIFRIFLGDMTLGIACDMPYPGWKVFKPAIMKVLQAVNALDFIQKLPVERYSLKYVDLIQTSSVEGQVGILDLDLRLSDFFLKSEDFQIRFNKINNEFLHLITLVSPAVTSVVKNVQKKGVVIDVDTLRNLTDTRFTDVMNDLDRRLECIHTANKIEFFKSLTDEAIESLEPEYE